VFCDFWAD